jgi:hypothetical protein
MLLGRSVGERVVAIFRKKLNPLQALEIAEAKKTAKSPIRPSIAVVALVMLGTVAFVVLEKPDPRDQTEAQAALNKTEHLSTDAQSSTQPTETPVQVADAFAQLGDASATPAEPATRKLAKLDRSPDEQIKRRTLLQTLTTRGIFIKAELPDNLPKLWVGRAFHSLDLNSKEAYVSVVHAYYLDGSDEHASVRVFDGKTNKEIGYFTLAAGLKLY